MSDLQRTYKPVWQTDTKLETNVREMHIQVQLHYKMFVALPRFTPWEKRPTRTWSTPEMSQKQWQGERIPSLCQTKRLVGHFSRSHWCLQTYGRNTTPG